MIRPIAYEGSEPYIFISYAHKDSDRVLPIVSALQERGFRVWYDAGIEAGSEWPEYIAEHLERCTVFLAFLSEAAVDSINCRQEIHFAIESRKELLIIYLEEITLSAGMRMRLGPLQAMYRNRHSSLESFLEELCRSRVLVLCGGISPTRAESKPDFDAIYKLFEFTQNEDIGIEITKLKDKSITSIEIPRGITHIGECVFEDCPNLTSVTLPDSVTIIGLRAFSGCRNLTSITIPNSVTSIGLSAFSGCRNLTNITIPNGVASIGPTAFSGCGLTSVIIPSSVTIIEYGTFDECIDLRSVIIPNSVTRIDTAAFQWCQGLRNIIIPNSIVSIGASAFNDCDELTFINIPDSVTSIEDNAFYRCENLVTIIIPESVISIGKDVFDGCEELTIYCKPGSAAEQYALENKIPFAPI